jgi:hypothetical protein
MPQNPNLTLIGTNPSGSYVPASYGVQGDLQMSQLHGSKYNRAVSGNLFFGANPSGVTTSVALATTYVGLCLSNPAGNTKNLVLRRVSAIFSVVQAAKTAVGLITGYAAGGITVHTTPLTPKCANLLNAVAATGKLDSACTLVGASANAPLWGRWLSSGATATSDPSVDVDVEGGLVIVPGAYVAIGTLIAGPTSGFLGSMEWEEVDVLS